MSDLFAFREPIFQTYAMIWLGILLGSGLLLGILALARRGDPGVRSMLLTYRSWWAILPLIALPLGLGRHASIIAFTILSLACFHEFARATGLYRDLWFTGTVFLAIVLLNVVAWIRWYGMFLVLPMYAVALLLILPVLRNRTEGMIQNAGLSIMGFLYFGWFLGHLSYLTNLENALPYLLFLTLAVALNDVAAFATGKLFGRRPLVPQVSPRKTWGGAVGCVAVTAIVVWALRSMLPGFGTKQLLFSILIIGVGGQLGDLVISFVKRDLGVKDLGTILPGHGGWLDRFDSLIFVSPLFFHMVAFYFAREIRLGPGG
ncbi:MAG TPA: phosphatidate cytidylyltransferase [Candidatus Polarisedimenticolia bacterium]|nr:phosphatidate cytidylyltransferase [Candidatus Polarisedimenticolia bacterium]